MKKQVLDYMIQATAFHAHGGKGVRADLSTLSAGPVLRDREE